MKLMGNKTARLQKFHHGLLFTTHFLQTTHQTSPLSQILSPQRGYLAILQNEQQQGTQSAIQLQISETTLALKLWPQELLQFLATIMQISTEICLHASTQTHSHFTSKVGISINTGFCNRGSVKTNVIAGVKFNLEGMAQDMVKREQLLDRSTCQVAENSPFLASTLGISQAQETAGMKVKP